MELRGRRMGTRWFIATAICAAAAGIGVGFFLSIDVARQTQDLVRSANDIPVNEISTKDRADLVRNALQYQADNLTKIWTGIIGSLTGVAAVAAGIIAWRNLQATQARLEVDRDGQITDRFTKAIDQLGSLRADKEGKSTPTWRCV